MHNEVDYHIDGSQTVYADGRKVAHYSKEEVEANRKFTQQAILVFFIVPLAITVIGYFFTKYDVIEFASVILFWFVLYLVALPRKFVYLTCRTLQLVGKYGAILSGLFLALSLFSASSDYGKYNAEAYIPYAFGLIIILTFIAMLFGAIKYFYEDE